jgi:hypothetical protein
MKGDFSRIRFNRRKNYTAVLDQQGRVALDADANEQCFIDGYLRTSEIVDVVGEFGGPVGDAGFQITVVDNEILIGPGRYYVDGLLCENPTGLSYDQQPYLIESAYSGAELLTKLAGAQGAAVLQVYLQVWQRLVTELDDPCLREPALGRADTTARLQTIWRVVAELAKAPQTQGSTDSRIPPTPSCCQEMYAAATQSTTGTMSAMTSGPTADCGCQPVAPAGYQGIENQLYRVEIHTPGDETTATFKWSRENGSVVSAVTGISGATLQLDTLGPDANLGYQAQQWVEVCDDTYLFGDEPNKPGTLYQIQSIRPADLSVTVVNPVTGIDTGRNARMRRWDQSGPTAGAAGIPLATGSWHQLENGIQIQFSAGTYNSGDYWTIPARTASGQIDWPPCGSDGNAFQPPATTRVYRAPLACIHSITGDRVTSRRRITWDDCRRLFDPLTSLTAPVVPPAIHVVKTSWANDMTMTVDQLVAKGLVVVLDQTPSSPITGANFIVTAELATGLRVSEIAGTAGITAFFTLQPATPILRSIAIIEATIGVSGNTVSWKPQQSAFAILEELGKLAMAVRSMPRVRVKLLGEMIFAKGKTGLMYLDGRALGVPGSDSNHISLELPSGQGSVASDFDSWFYLAPALEIIEVKPAEQEFTVILDEHGNVAGVSATGPGGPPVQAEATVTVNYPASATVNLLLQVDPDHAGFAGFAGIPATVQLDGQPSATFPIKVVGNPVDSGNRPVTVTFTITASLTPEIGAGSAKTARFTVTGASFIS